VKPAAFDYVAPASVAEALELLAGEEDHAILAGGQSLVAMMNFRLARPELVIDVNGVGELSGVEVVDGMLRLGATVRHAQLERDAAVADGWPLLRAAVRHVGHAAIRSRGTIGGSCAHADAAAELPVALSALDARLRLRSRSGERLVGAEEFFVAHLTTTREDDELVVGVEVPPVPPGARVAFVEHARTHGDWAIAAAAVVAAPGHGAIALLGAAPRPLRAREAEGLLAQGAPPAEVARSAGALVDDPWRSALTTALVQRALEEVAA
jgi:CO/xanthine dehydrogenase FAD-binding subunit